jgi:DNA-binding LytR/AlgR family response regulator
MVVRKIRCYIIEDDPSAQFILCHYISKFERLELIGSASTATEAINFLSKDTVDVLFLDLNLPDLHGLKMLEKIKHQPLIVFTTGYAEYAVKSFKHNVIDYLLKPVSEKEFRRAISRVIEKLNLQETVNQILYPAKHQIIEIDVNSKQEFINTSEILYAQSYGNYVKIHFHNNLIKLATISTKKLLEKLPGSKFLRIHKSYVINTDFITKYNNHSVLIGDQTLPVGISYRHHVDLLLNNQ